MSSAIKALNPITHVKNTIDNLKSGDIKQAILDPGDVVSVGDSTKEQMAIDAQAASDATAAQAQADEQDRLQASTKDAERVSKKKKKKGTQDILTSPLGATGDVSTAITKLGGS